MNPIRIGDIERREAVNFHFDRSLFFTISLNPVGQIQDTWRQFQTRAIRESPANTAFTMIFPRDVEYE